jgi:hypothetical protein
MSSGSWLMVRPKVTGGRLTPLNIGLIVLALYARSVDIYPY